ncbi:YadA-like family protein [Neisseria sp. 83E34]|uniref:YadA-like family protein n=1 Tax=Neisseria sp. 83E34 TaxID=1692264 RepID=UPI0009EC872A|nr:YadA-like family protein [Neisseria sp. 83E34]
MNKNYRTIWNDALGAWVAVSEIEKAKGKPAGSRMECVSCGQSQKGKWKFTLSMIAAVIGMTFGFSGSANAAFVNVQCKYDTADPESKNLICGNDAVANANQSVAVGTKAAARGKQAVAVGADTSAAGNSSVAIGGDDLDAVATNSAIPNIRQSHNDNTYNNTAAAVKYHELTGDYLVPFSRPGNGVGYRYSATTAGNGGVAIGVSAVARDLSTAFGTRAVASGDVSLALGVGSKATKDNAVAIGAGSSTETNAAAPQSVTINDVTFNFRGGANLKAGDQVSFGSDGFERQLKHVAPGQITQDSTDGVNGSQLYSVAEELTRVRGNVNTLQDEKIHFYSVKDTTSTVAAKAGNYNNDGATGNNALAAGVGVSASGANSLAVGKAAQTTATSSVAIGDSSQATNSNTIAMGTGAAASAKDSIALGTGVVATGDVGSVAIGNTAQATHSNSIAIGTARATESSAVAIGNEANAAKKDGVALGYRTSATEASGVAVGSNATSTIAQAVAIGYQANSAGYQAMALGSAAHAEKGGAVALGRSTKARGGNSLALGHEAQTGIEGSTVATDGSAAIAIGSQAKAQKTDSVAMGTSALSSASKAVAIGSGSIAAGSNTFSLGASAGSEGVDATNPNLTNISARTNEGKTSSNGLVNMVNIGYQAGKSTVNNNYGVNIGYDAGVGYNSYYGESISIGRQAGSLDKTNAAVLSAMEAASVTKGASQDSRVIITGNTNTAISSRAGVNALGHDNVAIGKDAGGYSSGNANVAIGRNAGREQRKNPAGAYEDGAVAGVFSNKTNTTSIGEWAHANANHAIAVGTRAKVEEGKTNAVAIGYESKALHNDAVALGSRSETADVVTTPTATVVGFTYGSFAGSDPRAVTSTVSVGKRGGERTVTNVAAGRITADSTDAVNGSQLFRAIEKTQHHYFSVQNNNQLGTNYLNEGATGTNSMAIGKSAVSNVEDGVALGYGAVSGNDVVTNTADNVPDAYIGSVAIGRNAHTSGKSAIAVGLNTEAYGRGAIAIGDYADAKFGQAVALGAGSVSTRAGSIAVGSASRATADHASAFGVASNASVARSVALGSESVADRGVLSNVTVSATPSSPNQLYASELASDTQKAAVAATVKGNLAAVSVGSNEKTRQIINVAAGSADSDAVNVAQLKAAVQSTQHHDYSVNSVEPQADTNYNNQGATGINAMAAGVSASAAGERATAVGNQANASASNATAVGNEAVASAKDTVAVGQSADATADSAVAVGKNADASGDYAVSIGLDSHATNQSAVALGSGANAAGSRSTALGNDTQAAGNESVAVGYLSQAATNTSVAIGRGAVTRAGAGNPAVVNPNGTSAVGATDGFDTVAIGTGAAAVGDQSIAIGRNSGTGGLGSKNISIGDAAGQNTQTGENIFIGYQAGKGRTASSKTNEGTPFVAGNNIGIGSDAGSNGAGEHNSSIGWKAGMQQNGDHNANIVALAGHSQTGNFNYNIGYFAGANTNGDENINIGKEAGSKDSSSEVLRNKAISIGSKAGASATNAIAMGSEAKASAEYAVAIGTAAKAFGNNASAVGVGANALGMRSSAFGNDAAAQGEQALALGNNSIAANAKDVALGADSVTEAAQGTSSATVNNIAYGNFAGAAPAATVSVGSGNVKRTVTNVAAGRISADSTDAVNGSQLYLTQQALGNVGGSVANVLGGNAAMGTNGNIAMSNIGGTSENTVDGAIRAVNTQANNPLTFGGDNSGNNFNRKLGQEVFVKGGAAGELSDNNIAVESDGNNTLNVKLAKSLTGLTSAAFTDGTGNTTTVNGNGMTIAPANGQRVSLSENGLDNGGNKITNVLAGNQDSDAVNVKQLQDALKDLSVSNLSVVEANSPFSYVNSDGKQLIRKVDKQGQVTFVTAEDNQLYAGNDITIAALNPNKPQTTVATKVGNVAAGTKNTDAVNVSQLTPIAQALGMNVDAASGTVAAPSFTVTQANGTPYAPASTVQEALTNVGKEIQKPITFAGNISQTEKHLGDTLNIQGGLGDTAAASTQNIRTKVDNGVMQIELAERPQFGNLTLNADGAGKITGLSEGAVNNNSQEAVNGSQLYKAGKGVESIVGGSTVYNPDSGTFTNNDIGGTGQNNIDAAIRAINTSVGAAWNLSAEGANSSKVASGNTVDLSSDDNNIVISKTATSDNVTFDLAKDLTGLTSAQFTDGAGNQTTVNGDGVTIQPVDGSDAVKLTTSGLNNGGKKVTNIAKGNVSDSSKDAVNGSQLYGTANSIAQTLGGNAAVGADGNVAMSDIGGTGQNTVNEAIKHVAQGFKLNTSNDGGGEVSNNKEAVVKAGETITVDAGSNIKLTQTGKTVSVATKADVNFNSVVAGTGVDAVTLDGNGVKVNGKTYVSDAGLNANNKAISNVAAGKQAEDAVNVSQLNPIAEALGVPVNPNTGTVAAPSWVVTKADGSKYDGVSTVQDALNNIGTEIQKPINFAGNTGNTAKRLGDTFTVKGGLAATANASSKNIRTEVGNNGEMLIELAESPTFGNVVVNAEGSGRIAGVTAGQDDQDAVNIAQLKGVNKNVEGNMQALGGKYDPVTNTYTPPSFATKSADGQAKQSVNTVQEALTNLNDEIVKPITFSADDGQNSTRVLGSTMAIKAGNFNGAASADNLITSNDGNGTITIKLADAPTFKGKVSAVGLDAGNQKITGVAEGEQDRDAVNMAQLKRAMEDIIVENQTLVEANSPFSYVNGAGEQLIRKVDPDGTVHFEKAKDKTKYDGKDIIISALNAVDPQTATPTRVTNLAKGTANTDAVAVSQLRDTVRVLGGQFNEVDGSITDPVYEIQRADGTTLERVGNVKDALTKLNSVMQDPITITGNTNQGTSTRVNNGSDQKLGSVLSIRGASVDGTASADNVRTVVSDNQVEIQLADAPTFKGKLSARGLDAGGEKITNVGAGENPNDAVNKSQLDEIRTLVGDGWNISANGKAESKVVPGNKVDFNNADSNIVISKTADSHNVTFDLAENINIGKANPISINGKAGTIGGLTNTTFDAANPVTGQAATENQLAAVANTPLIFAGDTGGLSERKLGSTVTVKGGVTEADKLTENNIGVVSDGNGTLEVKLAKNIKLGADGSLAAGNTVVNNDGVAVGNEVALTADGLRAGDVRVSKAGIDAGNKTIGNVADAENDTDAVNLKQLKDFAAASSNKVAAGKNVEITPEKNADGSTTYKVATKDEVEFTRVASGNGANQVVLDDSGVNVGGNTYISARGLDANNQKVSNVAAGNISATSTDAVNGSQLFNAGRKVADALGGGSTVDADGNVTAPAYALTGGNPATGESKTYNDVGEALNGLDKAVNQPLTFAADSGSNVERKLGSTLNVNGDGSNIRTETTADGVKVALNDQISVKQVQVANGPTINGQGIAMNNQQITGLRSGLDGKTIEQIKAEGSSSEQWNNAATVGDLATVQNNVTNITNVANNILGTDDGKGNAYTNDKGELTEAGKLALKTYDVAGQTATNDNTVISAIKNMNEGGIKYFHTNDDSGQTTGGAVKDTGDSSASGKFATAVGFNAAANSENALAIGKGAQALAENALAIGTGNIVTGRNSGAIGDPSIVSGSNSYSLGNNNTVATDNTFVLGNSVTQTVANSVVLGNESAAVEVHKAAAGSSNYTYKGENDANVAGVKDVVGVVSVGKDGQTRQIQNVAAGVVSATSTDAINGSQLYYTNKAIEEVKGGGAGIVQYSNPETPTQPNGGTASNDVTLVGGNTNAPVVLHNVGAGSAPTDAVNVNQLLGVGNHLNQKIDDVGRRANAGTASAMAMAGLPQAYLPGKSMMAVSGSTYRGESGYAVGYSSISDNGNWIIKGTAGGNSRGHFGATAGVGYQW